MIGDVTYLLTSTVYPWSVGHHLLFKHDSLTDLSFLAFIIDYYSLQINGEFFIAPRSHSFVMENAWEIDELKTHDREHSRIYSLRSISPNKKLVSDVKGLKRCSPLYWRALQHLHCIMQGPRGTYDQDILHGCDYHRQTTAQEFQWWKGETVSCDLQRHYIFEVK